MGEFDLIERFFRAPSAALAASKPQVRQGIGDDCAVLAPTPGFDWCVSTDLLVEGRHFLSTVDPAALGHKALAVNLSDLAACGARPLGFTLALALPQVNEAWLAGFSGGLLALAQEHHCPLVGGDTTAGPLTVGITVFGEVPSGTALLRSGAKDQDDVWVSGASGEHLGQARAALEAFRGTVSLPQALFAQVRQRMERPTPRVTLGQALRGLASAAADVSDGLLGDLRHILKASGQLAAQLDAEQIAPFLIATSSLKSLANPEKDLEKTALDWFLNGGDDYELVFTAPASKRAQVLAAAAASHCTANRIGRVVQAQTGQPTIALCQRDGRLAPAPGASFDHFA